MSLYSAKKVFWEHSPWNRNGSVQGLCGRCVAPHSPDSYGHDLVSFWSSLEEEQAQGVRGLGHFGHSDAS